MTLHLYCIVPAGRAVPDACTGIDGQRPFAVQAGDLAAWASEHDAPVAPSIEAVRTHNDVVQAAMDREVTPVPIRFGQSVSDRDDAARHIATDAAKWIDLLGRFAGRAEYGVRALRETVDTEQDVHAHAESGTQYMAALARRHGLAAERRGEGERIATAIAERVGGLADDVRVEYPAAGPVLVGIAHLVAWTAADAYHGAMREVREMPQDTRLMRSGPWPPWSFVE